MTPIDLTTDTLRLVGAEAAGGQESRGPGHVPADEADPWYYSSRQPIR